MIDTVAIRNKVLFLAMRGKLVEQNQSDEAASILISKICKAMNSQKSVEDFNQDETPFEIPMSWKWCRLSDIGNTNIGLTYHPEDIVEEGTIVIRSNNIINGKMNYLNLVKVNCPIRENQYLNKNDIIICVRNGSKALVGKCAIYYGNSREESFGAFMAMFRTPFYKYVYCYFNTPVFRRYFDNDDTKQINQITQNILKNALIPLPPINEQHRIVDKINKIFNVLDTIDKLQSRYLSDVKVLKNKLIDAGIQGKLTKQLSEDGTAEDLYAEIQAERAKLMQDGKIKKEKALPEITEDEIPFDIPQNWKWVRLGEISWFQGGYAFKSNLYIENSDNQVIRLGNVKQNVLLLDARPVFISDELADEVKEFRIKENDILITMTGTRRKKDYFYAKCVEQSDLRGKKLYLNQRVACIKVLDGVYPPFVAKALQNTDIRNIIFEREKGAVNQGNLGSEDIKKFVYIPLPPYAEQIRIVEKINELLDNM